MRCSKCDKEGLGPDDFHKDARRKNGLRTGCKACHQQTARFHRRDYYQQNKEKIKQRQKEYYEKKKHLMLAVNQVVD